MSPKSSKFCLAAGLTVLTVAAHFRELNNGFIWDDPDYVTTNTSVHSPGGLWAIWTNPAATPQYYPLVFTTFWAEYRMWGLQPLGYHVDNILLHGTSAVLLWILLTRLKIPAAWLAAAIFAVHPVQVESVAWITERKNCLSGVFYLAAMVAYFRAPPRYKTAVIFFIAALLSKTVTATWPVVVLIVIWWKENRVPSRDLLRMTPLIAIGLAMGWVTAHLEQIRVGATGSDFNWTLGDRFLIAGHALWFYAIKLFWPLHLTFIYPKGDLHADHLMQWIQSIEAAALLILLVVLRRQMSRGPAAVGLIFVVTLLPALGFVNVYPMRYSFVADHFQYLACIALIIPAAVIIEQAVTRRLAWIVLAPLVFLTWQQAAIYHDPRTLWEATVAANPGSWMVHTNLGEVYYKAGDVKSAEEQYVLAVRNQPTNADAWWMLANFYSVTGRNGEAETAYRQALSINPDHYAALFNLAELLTTGDVSAANLQEGIADLKRVVDAEQGEIGPRLDLGYALLKQGQSEAAAEEFSMVLQMSPNNPQAMSGLLRAKNMSNR